MGYVANNCGFWIGGIDRFIELPPVVTTNNYYTIADLHNLQALHINFLSLLLPVVTTLAIAIAHTNNYNTSNSLTPLSPNVTLRLAVYSQSVRLGVKPLETHDQTFFFN
jgi:hypothetical protein